MVKINNIAFSYKEYDNTSGLSLVDQELVATAMEAALNAYAPYSKFRVGAAILLESGKIVSGANVENAAFPSGICAERCALSNTVSNHKNDKPVALAIAAMNDQGLTNEPVTPCGNCRQVIAEEESRTGKQIRIILAGKTKVFVIESVSSLLPLQFNNKNLKINLL
jgi:cytidine deaminase